RHEHNGAHTRITHIRNIAELPGGFPRRSTAEGAEPGIVRMLSAVRDAGSGTRLRAGDGQRSVATVRVAHHPDALPLDVGTELRVLQHRVDEAGDLPRTPDPHADAGDVVVLSAWVLGRSNNITMRGQGHCQVSMIQGGPTRPM